MAEPTTVALNHAPYPVDSDAYSLPKPGNYPPPPIADYDRPGQHAFEEAPKPAPEVDLPTRLTGHIAAWNTILVMALLALFLVAGTVGGFEIAHMTIAVGCFFLAGGAGAVALLLGYDREPLNGRVKLLEEVTVHLLERGGSRGRK